MKLLMLHASAGGGHKRAAEALAEAAAAAGHIVAVRDILDFVPPLFRATYATGLFADASRLAALSERAAQVGRPTAAADIIADVARRCGS